jgi:hypothetical protein
MSKESGIPKDAKILVLGSNPKSNYVAKLQEALTSFPIVKGTVNHVSILHDDWCGMLNGKEVCTCNPDIEYLGTQQ